MAEDKNPDLSTDTKRVEYYNQKVEEFRKENPNVSEVSEKAFDSARSYAQQGVFPPLGFIAFPGDSEKHTPDEMGIGVAAGNVLFGAARFLDGLKKDSPGVLIEKGIDTYKGFDDSAAVNELTGATKMSFATVKEGFQEIQTAIRADDKDAEDPFEKSPVLSKLNPDEIENLLNSTVLKFIKELGLKREDKASDKLTLDRGEESFTKAKEFAASVEAAGPQALETLKLNTKDDSEYMARLEKAKREDALMDSVTTSKTEVKVIQEIKKTEEKPEGIKATETPVPPPVQQTPAATSVAQREETPLLPVKEGNLNLAKEEEIAPIVQQTTATGPTVTETAQAPVTQIGKESTTKEEATNYADNPFILQLGKDLGFSKSDMKEVFGGVGASQITQGLREGLTGKTSESLANIVNESTAEGVKSPEPAPTTKVSEPTKMTTPAQATTTPPPSPTAAQENSAVSESEKPADKTTSPSPVTDMGDKKDVAKANEEIKKEEDKTNAELLKVMKDILRTLQGPLITTDGIHKFH